MQKNAFHLLIKYVIMNGKDSVITSAAFVNALRAAV